MKATIGADFPRCGRPQGYSLASPDTFVCDACGYSAQHPPAMAAQLRQAAQSLASVGASEKQLGAWQRRALRLSGRALALYLLGVGLLLVPALVSAGCTCVYMADSNAMGATMFGLPAIIVPVLALLGALVLYRTRTRLLEQSSTLPPLGPGATARCRGCGAPVTERGRHLIVRCAFCGTDNLVDPRVLGWLASHVRSSTDAVRLVRQRAVLAVGSGVFGLVLLPALTQVTPVVLGTIVLVLWASFIDTVESPPDLSARYVLEPVPSVGLTATVLWRKAAVRSSSAFLHAKPASHRYLCAVRCVPTSTWRWSTCGPGWESACTWEMTVAALCGPTPRASTGCTRRRCRWGISLC